MKSRARTVICLITAALTISGIGTAPTARADVDVYTTPGRHTVGGRQWNTTCSKYSSAIERCRAEIWGSQIVRTGNAYRQSTGWLFNNLTYKPQKRAAWKGNPLASPGLHTINGRRWRVECDTPTTGRNGCRAYIRGSLITKKGAAYVQTNGWVFNNLIRFTDAPPTRNQPLRRLDRRQYVHRL